MDSLKVTRKQAKPILDATFPTYNGRKVTLRFCETMRLFDLNWSGGTRSQYAFISSTGDTYLPSYRAIPPWDNKDEGATVTLQLGLAVVEHSIFCGKDCGITIYLHPGNLPKWIES